MGYINVLRQLVDQQQFSTLLLQAKQYLLETGDRNAVPLVALAHAHLGERDQAAALLAEAEKDLPALELEARVDQAAVYCLLWQIDKAEKLLEGALAIDPEHSLALARLAWVRMQQGRFAEALSLYQRSAALAPHRLPVWMAVTRLHLANQDHAAAQQALNAAIGRFEALRDSFSEPVLAEFTAQLRRLQLAIWVESESLSEAEQWLDERRDSLPEQIWCDLVVEYASLLAGRALTAEAEEALRGALRHYPENLALLSQWAELAQVQGRSLQAAQLLRRAIRLTEAQEGAQSAQTVRLWIRLSSACLHSMAKQARHAAERAIELADALQPDEDLSDGVIRQLRSQAKAALAQVESQEQMFERADTLFREVLAEAPYFVPALQGLGQQQMQRGNIDEAVALFETLKQVDPAKGYSSLINARIFPEDEATLEKIEQAARQPSLEGPVRAGLLLQLASAWEKRKEYDKAFALATEANEASKKHLRYDPKGHRNYCARIRHAFSKALYEHRRDCGVASSLPVFVVGMPRSGTTLVEQILAGHSRIYGAGELGVIPSCIAGLNRWERHTGSGRRYPDCVDDLTPRVTEGIANGILKELKELAAQDKPDALHVVDKLPHNFENIGLIKFLFPNARIISVRRDPRDIALSNYFTDYQAKHGGMGFAYDLTWIGEQLADHNLLMHHWHQVFPGEILEVHYEEVVDDLEGTARRMLEYIGVDWEPQVLDFNKVDRPVKTASVWQVRQPLYKSSKAKWTRYQKHLAPLIKGTNAKIRPDPVTDMITLPEPGFLTDGVAFFREGKLDEAELSFKKMLHHNPDHAACKYMVGLVYCCKGYVKDAIPLFEAALETCPWQKEWRDNLIRAYEETGATDKAEALRAAAKVRGPQQADEGTGVVEADDHLWTAGGVFSDSVHA